MRKLTLFLSLCLLTHLGHAEQSLRSSPSDERIKVAVFEADNIYPIWGEYGYSTHIILSPDEQVEKVDIGDANAWVVSASDNHLFVKPVLKSSTNLSVITNLHTYAFTLHTSAAPHQLTYALKFRYPQTEAYQQHLRQQAKLARAPIASFLPEKINWQYRYAPKQAKALIPAQVFDDGKFTYFKFYSNQTVPAIFLAKANQTESLVNYHRQGPYLVVNQVGRQFTLRLGNQAAAVFNEAGRKKG